MDEAPHLEEQGVDPWEGTPTFRVSYTDPENDSSLCDFYSMGSRSK